MPTFQDYEAAGFLDDLIPVLPADAEINPTSPHLKGLLKNRGKVPGKKQGDSWFGFGGWQGHHATSAQAKRWTSWHANIGLIGRRFPALDIDVDDAALADEIEKLAIAVLGDAPCRFGREPRRILVYSGANMGKRRLAFRRPDADPDAPSQAVEFLATKQQYVLEGVHAKTGQPYRWVESRSLLDYGPSRLRPVTADALATLFDKIEGLVELFGYVRGERSGGHDHVDGEGGGNGVWQDSLLAPSVAAIGRALAAMDNEFDYDTWIKITRAVRAAAGPEREAEAYELWIDWSLQWGANTLEELKEKWDGLRSPHRIGWDYLADLATNEGDGSFYGAHEDFDAVPGARPETAEERAARLEAADPLTAVQARYVWVENRKLVFDLEHRTLIDKEQLNVRHSDVGPIASASKSAWGQLLQNRRKLQAVAGVTYRPGAGLYVIENLPNLRGKCINFWQPSGLEMPDAVSDDDVEIWLEHAAVVVPEATERSIVLDWLAWFVQNPTKRVNWALVIGSSAEGIGKDMLLEPVRDLLGRANVQEIGPEMLASTFNEYLENKRLIIVQEMDMADKRTIMNKLKPMISAPPHHIPMNVKHHREFNIPNVLGMIFLTNMNNALALSNQGRRYMVVWNDGLPQPPAHFSRLSAWYVDGGIGKVARWLLQRDVTRFNATGPAPETEAREDMRLSARTLIDAVLEDGIAEKSGPFAHRLFTLEEVFAHIAPYGRTAARMMSPRQLVGKLKDLGAIQFDRKVTLGDYPGHHYEHPPGHSRKPCQLFANVGELEVLKLSRDITALRGVYWGDRLVADFDRVEEANDVE